MTNLNDIIEQAAQDRFPEEWDVDSDIVKRRKEFKAGLERAITSPDILREILTPFAEWFDNSALGVAHGGNGEWYNNNGDKLYTTEEIIAKYIQQ